MKAVLAVWIFGLALIGAAIANKDDMTVFLALIGASLAANVTAAALVVGPMRKRGRK